MKTLNPHVITFFRLQGFSFLLCGFVCLRFASSGLAQNVIAWGDNSQGQCNVPAEATNVVAVAAGLYHSLALRADGTVVGWGFTNPVPADLTGVTAIAAGLWHSLALRVDGTVVAWGDNTYGQTSVPTEATNVVAISSGNCLNLALRADGTVVSWGNDLFTSPVTIPTSLSNVVALAAGAGVAYLLQTGGNVVTVPMGTWPSRFKRTEDIVAISSAGSKAAALTGAGRVIDRTARVLKVPASVTNVVSLAARTNYFLALRSDGSLVAWGSGGVTNLPPAATNIISVAAGGYHGLAVSGLGITPRLLGPASYRDWAAVGDWLPLSCRAVGAQPLHYEWLMDGLPVSGTDTAFPKITAAPGPHTCQCIVSNSFGSISSEVATVTVLPVNVWGDNLNFQSVIPKSLSNVVAIAAGEGHCLALNSGGQVVAWGKNRDGQALVPEAARSNVVALAGGSDHSLALKNDGTLVAWGRNWDGQTNIPPEAVNVFAINAGWAHNLALRRDGTVLAWGNNDYGQTNTALLPSDFIAVAAGYFHSAALRSDGTVVTWGWSVPTPAAATNVIAIAAGWEHCLALRADGTVIGWGDNSYGQSSVPPDATNVVAIAAGYYHNLALRGDGLVLVWGRGACGVTNLPQALNGVVAIDAGGDYSMALVGQGPPSFPRQPLAAFSGVGGHVILSAEATGAWPLAFQWFHNGAAVSGATNRFLVLSDIQSAAAGNYVLVATSPAGQTASETATLTVSSGPVISAPAGTQRVPLGQMFCLAPAVSGSEPMSFQWQHFGTNLADSARMSGSSSPQLYLSSAEYSDNGTYSLLAQNSFGAITTVVAQVSVTPIIAWGDNLAGELEVPSTATNVLTLAAGGQHSLALRSDGSLVGWGDDTYGGNEPPASASNIVCVAEGQYHSVGLRADGKVLCWGDNSFGQTNVPASASNVVAVAAGAFHTLALRADGSVVAWGFNTNGQTTVPSSVVHVIAVAASDFASFALKTDGTIVRWGKGPTPPVGNFVDLAAGDNHLLVLRPNGTLLGSGNDDFGQATVPGGLLDFVAIAAGGDHSLALLGLGSIAAWGADYSGETDVPANASNIVTLAAGDIHNLALVPEPGLRMAPVLVQQPLSGTGSPGGTFVLNAAALGARPLTYQWYFNGAPLSAQTRRWLALQDLQNSHVGMYQVSVNNAFGSLTSRVATLNVQVLPGAPVILSQSGNQSVTAGAYVTVSVISGGSTPLFYQWKKDGLNLADGGRLIGTATSDLIISNTQPDDAGSYTVAVSNTVGKAVSAPIVLAVSVPAPSLMTPLRGPNGLVLQFYAFSGVEYVIEFADRLDAPVWEELETRLGQGTVETVAIPSTDGATRFYRLRLK